MVPTGRAAAGVGAEGCCAACSPARETPVFPERKLRHAAIIKRVRLNARLLQDSILVPQSPAWLTVPGGPVPLELRQFAKEGIPGETLDVFRGEQRFTRRGFPE